MENAIESRLQVVRLGGHRFEGKTLAGAALIHKNEVSQAAHCCLDEAHQHSVPAAFMSMNEKTCICHTNRKQQAANELQLMAIQHNTFIRTGEGASGNSSRLRWMSGCGAASRPDRCMEIDMTSRARVLPLRVNASLSHIWIYEL